ncbi:MAG TPA: hypothetical protein VGI75_01310, partial [Pirellulales bacterium]
MFDGAIVLERRLLRNLARLSALAPLFVGVYYAAFWLRFGDDLGNQQSHVFAATVAWVVVIKLAFFGLLHVYRHWSRHVSLHELTAIIKAAGTSTGAMWLMRQMLFAPRNSFSGCILLLDFGGTILTVGGLRMALRVAREKLGSQTPSKK